MNKAKDFINEFQNKLNNGYFDKLEAKEKEWLVEFVDKIYHKDMIHIKVDLDMYECGTYYKGEHKLIPAGSWVYIYQDEGGVTLYDEEMKYCCDIDYSIPPEDILYEE